MKTLSLALVSAAALALTACGEPADTTPEADNVAADQMANDNDEAAGTIVDVAQGNGDFSTLVAAVTAANLGETLSGPGPYTVFAPSNAAFDKLPDGTVDELTTAEDKTPLTNILTYHVVEGETMAAALQQAITDGGEDGATLTTVNGATLTAMVQDGNVVLTDAAGNTATVTQTDIDASNGVIHVIDTVLMPE